MSGSILSGKPKFKGSMTALITPFKNGKFDEEAFKQLIDNQINEGTDGLIPVGTTGESPTLSHEEHEKVVEICVNQTSKRVPVIAGSGSNSTEEASKLASHAAKAGADAVLVVSPYYNKPTQNGLYYHFMKVADSAKIPLIVYDIPGRSIVKVSDETLVKLSENHEMIVGIKDATADLSRPPRLINLIGSGYSQLSGEDATALPYLASGGHGCISVTSNIAPGILAKMHDAWNSHDFKSAFDIHLKMIDLHDALFCESSPGPVKYAAKILNICESSTRLPLCEISNESKLKVENALKKLSLIK